jgi:hypothetical protein
MADSETFVPARYAGRHNNHVTLPSSDAISFPKGTLVAQNQSDGRAYRPATGLIVSGVSEGDFDNSDGLDDAMNVELAIGVHELKYSGGAPKAGQIVYAADNQTVTLTPGTDPIAGVTTEPGADGKVCVMVDPVLNSILMWLRPLFDVGANGEVLESDGTNLVWGADA